MSQPSFLQTMGQNFPSVYNFLFSSEEFKFSVYHLDLCLDLLTLILKNLTFELRVYQTWQWFVTFVFCVCHTDVKGPPTHRLSCGQSPYTDTTTWERKYCILTDSQLVLLNKEKEVRWILLRKATSLFWPNSWNNLVFICILMSCIYENGDFMKDTL